MSEGDSMRTEAIDSYGHVVSVGDILTDRRAGDDEPNRKLRKVLAIHPRQSHVVWVASISDTSKFETIEDTREWSRVNG